MRYHRIVNVSMRVFIGVSALLYFSFTICDIFFDQVKLSSGLKFTSICLCFLMTLIGLFCDFKNKDCWILSAALLFTVTADIFLLLSDHYTIGVFSFCIVQLIYLYRIQTITRVKMSLHLILRLAISVGILAFVYFLNIEVDFLLGITVFYFVNFVGNIGLLVKACTQRKTLAGCENSEVNIPVFLVGMILFILCDISVGIYNLNSYLDLSGTVYQVLEGIAAFGMWGFYLPGQVCIALSTKKR